MKNDIVSWIDRYLLLNSKDALIIGVSGGVDSALTSVLCAETGKNTFVVSLPIHQDKSQLQRAENHIDWLSDNYKNILPVNIDLSNVFDCFSKCFKGASGLSLANSRSRLRMTALYQIASSNNGIVVGTGNKIEDFGIGFFTKYGDGGVDISPIADLTKTEVSDLALEVGISKEIIDASPTDGLWSDNRTDEDQIGATYQELEWAMSYRGGPLTERQTEVLNIYNDFHRKNSHKMNPIPVWKK